MPNLPEDDIRIHYHDESPLAGRRSKLSAWAAVETTPSTA